MSYISNNCRRNAINLDISSMRLLDDIFMSKFFDNHPAEMATVLRIVLEKDDINVLEVKTQYSMDSLYGRGARLDVMASDEDGKFFNVEVQRSTEGAARKRARFNSSIIDSYSLDKGKGWNALPETYVIFFVENDVLKGNLPIYHVERKILETGELFNDDEHIIYVNCGKHDVDDNNEPLENLIHDFNCRNPGEMKLKDLSSRANELKNSRKEGEIMCEQVEKILKEHDEQLAKEHEKSMIEKAQVLISKGVDDEIVQSTFNLTDDELKALKSNSEAQNL